ncbi:MAG TPA: response regulator [Candidatus Omnitrophica bacterium]|nr:response regulator [Candidatus Omnitrophota bacterium]
MHTILIVDDEKRIRNIYAQLFSKEGLKVIAVSNAMDANDILLKEKVDIMLLDINMPEVDGSTLGEITNAFHKKTKVIVVSVYPVDDQEQIVKRAVGYYDKSQGLNELVKKVRAVLCNGVKKKILIVDDEQKACDLFSRLLNDAGYCPITKAGAKEALQYSKEHEKDIDLIILDLDMPELDGIDFFDVIKDVQPQVKVIIASVYPVDEQKFSIFDADDYYDKSDSNSILIDKINKLL